MRAGEAPRAAGVVDDGGVTSAPTTLAADARTHTDDLAAFVTASPSSFHAAAEVARRVEEAGFTRLDEREGWPTAPGRHVVVRDGAVIAWVVPAGAGPTTAFRVLGAHTDSPGLVLKPHPAVQAFGWLQAGVEVYGGPLLDSWFDRELELAGRVVTRDGTEHLVRTGPLLRVPHLAIHLDRSSGDTFSVDRQRHTQPVWGLAGGAVTRGDLLARVAACAGLTEGGIAGFDLRLTDTQEPRVLGADEALLASGRLDNLLSVHAGLAALLDAAERLPDDGPVLVLAAFDHEEVGSATRSGAAGPFLADVLGRVGAGLGAGPVEHTRALAASWCVSSDVGHSIHPNYPEKHDPVNQPVAGRGPILKLNANQRYASDAVGSAAWGDACEDAGVPHQEFVSNNAVPCGSTIGPITATRLGMRVTDVGAAILSMHSARELCAVDDPWYLARAMASALVTRTAP